jgi:hypothetical protein
MDYQKEISHAAVDAGRTWCSATNRMWCKAARCFGAGLTDLRALFAHAGRPSDAYTDVAFPDRPFTLHVARPERWMPETPIVFSHHGRSPQRRGLPGLLSVVRRRA